MKLPRRHFLHLAGGAAVFPAVSRIARAQAYPTRPVRFIVPYPPGGATDAAARVVGEFLSRSLGQQIVVENKSGGGSLIGVESAARARRTAIRFWSQRTSSPAHRIRSR